MSLVWSKPQTPFEIVDEAINKYEKDSFYVLLSGGKDSICMAHFIATNYPMQFKGCVFTNTGLATQATRKFVIEYCKEMGWPLFMTWPSEEDRYYNVIMQEGFATVSNHRIVMGRLKYHSWYYFLREKILKGEKAAFISGVRKKESNVRKKKRKYTKKPIDINSRFEFFIKPFLYKDGSYISEYHIIHGLKSSPAYDWLNKSGECLCGSFVEPWELKMLEKYDSLSFETITWLESEIKKHGSKNALKNPKWGNSNYTKDIQLQTGIEDYCGESCIAS